MILSFKCIMYWSFSLFSIINRSVYFLHPWWPPPRSDLHCSIASHWSPLSLGTLEVDGIQDRKNIIFVSSCRRFSRTYLTILILQLNVTYISTMDVIMWNISGCCRFAGVEVTEGAQQCFLQLSHTHTRQIKEFISDYTLFFFLKTGHFWPFTLPWKHRIRLLHRWWRGQACFSFKQTDTRISTTSWMFSLWINVKKPVIWKYNSITRNWIEQNNMIACSPVLDWFVIICF